MESTNMGRKALKPHAPVTTELDDPKIAQGAQALIKAETAQLLAIENAITVDQIQVSEVVGMVKAFSFTQKLLTVSSLKVLSEIKESKKYKGLKLVSDEGELLTVSTWDQFCGICGVSHQKVDQDLLNLHVLGEDFLESSQRLGLGYRELRKLRRLPDDTRELIVNGEAIKTGDKDALVDLIEEMAAKHIKERDLLQGKLKTAEENQTVHDKQLDAKNKKIDQLQSALDRFTVSEDAERALSNKREADAVNQLIQTSQAMFGYILRWDQAVANCLAVGTESATTMAEQTMLAMFQRIAQQAIERNMPVDFQRAVIPEWMADLVPSDDEEVEG